MIRDKRITIIHAVLVVFALALVARAARVQLWQRDYWLAEAAKQQYADAPVPAQRGEILDATGKPLASSRTMLKLAVSPREVRDRRRVSAALARLKVPAAVARRVLDSTRVWVDVPGTYSPTEAAPVLGLRGVTAKPLSQRVYVMSEGLRKIVGRTDVEGKPVDGIESALDSLLRGREGSARVLRDARGRRYQTPDLERDPPRAGHSVLLTVNRQLQDIADRSLGWAMETYGAGGGDIVVLDPQTGEILAMSSRRGAGGGGTLTALTEPFQPGSTLKPLFAARLLEWKRAKPTDVVETFYGKYTIYGRTINDVHQAPRLSLADVIRWSSNVGIVRFMERMSAREEYETLRDYGFGTATGVPHSSESPGTLYEPKRWSKQSAASLAIGYELNVTPLQLAAAYGSLANGGLLLSPALVKEVRSPDGHVVYRHEPRVVRRVTTPQAAASVLEMLAGVVDSGTATDAQLTTFEIGGKSGTARRTQGKHYVAGSYTSSFVGLFPARNPQYVILVKIDNPSDGYYGGKIAAPVARQFVEAAFAARESSLDAARLAEGRIAPRPPKKDSAPAPVKKPQGPRLTAAQRESLEVARVAEQSRRDSLARLAQSIADTIGKSREADAALPFVVNVAHPVAEADLPARPRTVPDVRGLTVRRAVLLLHASGFRVRLERGDGGTLPAAGTVLREGEIVRLAVRP